MIMLLNLINLAHQEIHKKAQPKLRSLITQKSGFLANEHQIIKA
jgi:hypothetical protein